MTGGLNAQTHFVTSNIHNSDDNVIANHDRFVAVS